MDAIGPGSIRERLNALKLELEDYRQQKEKVVDARSKIEWLSSEPSHPALVPMGPLGFLHGTLIETGKVSVIIGDYCVKMSTTQANNFYEKRASLIDSKIKEIEGAISAEEGKMRMAKDIAMAKQEYDKNVVEIKEPYLSSDEEEEVKHEEKQEENGTGEEQEMRGVPLVETDLPPLPQPYKLDGEDTHSFLNRFLELEESGRDSDEVKDMTEEIKSQSKSSFSTKSDFAKNLAKEMKKRGKKKKNEKSSDILVEKRGQKPGEQPSKTLARKTSPDGRSTQKHHIPSKVLDVRDKLLNMDFLDGSKLDPPVADKPSRTPQPLETDTQLDAHKTETGAEPGTTPNQPNSSAKLTPQSHQTLSPTISPDSDAPLNLNAASDSVSPQTNPKTHPPQNIRRKVTKKKQKPQLAGFFNKPKKKQKLKPVSSVPVSSVPVSSVPVSSVPVSSAPVASVSVSSVPISSTPSDLPDLEPASLPNLELAPKQRGKKKVTFAQKDDVKTIPNTVPNPKPIPTKLPKPWTTAPKGSFEEFLHSVPHQEHLQSQPEAQLPQTKSLSAVAVGVRPISIFKAEMLVRKGLAVAQSDIERNEEKDLIETEKVPIRSTVVERDFDGEEDVVELMYVDEPAQKKTFRFAASRMASGDAQKKTSRFAASRMVSGDAPKPKRISQFNASRLQK